MKQQELPPAKDNKEAVKQSYIKEADRLESAKKTTRVQERKNTQLYMV